MRDSDAAANWLCVLFAVCLAKTSVLCGSTDFIPRSKNAFRK
ncbi:hypothetical protein NECAME_13462 [Necator americanus]|uniref:Uncharacterized protein n=1 Tax=Necator americanus TaxID=51031 RepID=W2SYM4_NECAM|nr:hypothetical protein NECAME_13462 [Necator americanus]ETN73742.1 hypothetical protein NECAME_13462 [Necator americanus]